MPILQGKEPIQEENFPGWYNILCNDCDNTGKIAKWVPISEVAQEVQKLQEIADWANTLRDISITNVPTLPANQDDLNIPPNINIYGEHNVHTSY